MRVVRTLAIGITLLIAAGGACANFLAPADYATQFRDAPDAAPSRQHPLGTDDLGRDRLSRVLYGTRVSLLLAPAAALLCTGIAALVGTVAGYAGGWLERLALAVIDLFLSVPWLFLLLMVRALLPLNISPWHSAAVTFLLLGALGWAAAARVICAGARDARNSDFVLQSKLSGTGSLRLLGVHVLPNLRPLLLAQLWISIPIFIIAEANLSVLGLGVSEPLPSWGGLIRELEGVSSWHVWKIVPIILLILVTSSFELLMRREDWCS